MSRIILLSLLALSTLTTTTLAAPGPAPGCSPPNILVAVGMAKFPVPLFKDCKYGDPGAVIPMPPSPAPPMARTASADYNSFVDNSGMPLNPESMKKLLAFFGQAVPLEILLEQTICTVTDKKNPNLIMVIEDGDGRVEGQEELNPGKTVDVGSYRCVIDL